MDIFIRWSSVSLRQCDNYWYPRSNACTNLKYGSIYRVSDCVDVLKFGWGTVQHRCWKSGSTVTHVQGGKKECSTCAKSSGFIVEVVHFALKGSKKIHVAPFWERKRLWKEKREQRRRTSTPCEINEKEPIEAKLSLLVLLEFLVDVLYIRELRPLMRNLILSLDKSFSVP